MVVLRLSSKGLYRVIKLHEEDRVGFCNLGFIAFSLVSFLMSGKKFFSLPSN